MTIREQTRTPLSNFEWELVESKFRHLADMAEDIAGTLDSLFFDRTVSLPELLTILARLGKAEREVATALDIVRSHK